MEKQTTQPEKGSLEEQVNAKLGDLAQALRERMLGASSPTGSDPVPTGSADASVLPSEGTTPSAPLRGNTLSLILTVTLDTDNDPEIDLIADNLQAIAQAAIDNGDVTGDYDPSVEAWNAGVYDGNAIKLHDQAQAMKEALERWISASDAITAANRKSHELFPGDWEQQGAHLVPFIAAEQDAQEHARAILAQL